LIAGPAARKITYRRLDPRSILGKEQLMTHSVTQRSDKSIAVRVRSSVLSDLVAGALRTQIVRGELRRGERLPPEATMMSEFAVSRATVREAMRILESERLIDLRPGDPAGPQISTPDRAIAARYIGMSLQLGKVTLDELLETKLTLELAVIRRLATRECLPLDDFRTAVESLAAMTTGRTMSATETDQWIGLDRCCNRQLFDMSGSQTLALQISLLWEVARTHLESPFGRATYPSPTPRELSNVVREYVEMIRLIERHDADAAANLWRSRDCPAKHPNSHDPSDLVLDLFE
jgi:GntR family transcriptional regulator, transcriptional repressor for pyruvate dehydrogenase complex